MKYRLTRGAERDVAGITRQTRMHFGPRQVDVYVSRLRAAVELVSEQPDRASSSRRDDIGRGVRSLHVGVSGRRRSAASHVLYYSVRQAADGERELVVLRILHEAMDPRSRVVRAAKSER